MEHKGTKTIETKRLILRPVRMSDAEDMFYGWASDNEVTKYMTWKSHPDIETTKNYIADLLKRLENKECYDWIIEYKETQKAIGSIGVVSFNDNFERAEAGYCLSKKYWNKGIMTEALTAVIKYLFDEAGFNRIEAFYIAGNEASGRVMKKCNMKFEGTEKQKRKDNNGNFCDASVYAILKKDFEQG